MKQPTKRRKWFFYASEVRSQPVKNQQNDALWHVLDDTKFWNLVHHSGVDYETLWRDQPFGEDGSRKECGAEVTHGTLYSLTHFILRRQGKTLISMEGAWRRNFNDGVARAHPTKKTTWSTLEVKGNIALTLKNHVPGSVKTWVRMPPSHTKWKQSTIKEPQCTVLVQIFRDNLNELLSRDAANGASKTM